MATRLADGPAAAFRAVGIRRSSDAQAERRTRVTAAHWQLLRRFQFKPDAAERRIAQAAPQWQMLGLWCVLLVGAGWWAGGRQVAAMNPRPSSTGGWSALRREAGLLTRDRSVWAWWLVVLCLSVLAVATGLSEVQQQRATIARLAEADRADRQAVLAAQKDWGSAADCSFHLTADPPSHFAFAALGRRDDAAWKHRVRMLALEGQIHERDAGQSVLAQTDLHAVLAYEARVRAFHAAQRAFYYPKLFLGEPFDPTAFNALPAFGAGMPVD